MSETTGKKRGFAAMDPALVKTFAQRGGKRAHELGKAHKYSSEEARQAGRKGGLARGARLRSEAEVVLESPQPSAE